MVGAAQVGVLAACVVLFVPMGMAGWHLSRNKMLFFSGALFITLAIGVHLTPYFPSLSHLLLSSLSPSPLPPLLPLAPASCLPFLHDILWSPSSDLKQPPIWAWSRSGPALACGFQKLGRADASDLLNGSWVMIAGDSQARLFALALLTLVLDPSDMEAVRADLFKRHSNYQIVVPHDGLQVDFIWAPFESNLTAKLGELQSSPRLPEVLVMGDGLWHMLHITDVSEYGAALASIKKLAETLLAPAATRSPHMFWFSLPTLVNPKLNTEEKQVKMSSAMSDAYEKEVQDSEILRRSGGPFLLLDVRSLSRGCGSGCTDDGMHYHPVIYEAAVQVMLNALLIESQQRI